MPSRSAAGVRTGVRVVVAGDRGTGKSSLISAAASDAFPEYVPAVLPPTRLPSDFYPDGVPVTIVDTSSSMESRVKLIDELKRADAVVLTYACDQPMTLSRLSSFWLPELRKLEIKAPVIVVGCKLDLRDERQPMNLEQVMAPIMQQFREIETCIECSSATLIQVPDVFYYAQKAVLHPTAPLFDQEKQTLKPRCIRALKRIFMLCDHDMDGALSDAELNEFQVKCFNAPLQPAEIVGVKRVVQERIRGGFGYNDELKLRDDILPVPTKHAPDQTVELTNEAIDFLRGIFRLYDSDNDGSLQPSEFDDIFVTAPESPWTVDPYVDAAERTPQGNLTINGFLSEWALMTTLDPSYCLANLICIGYGGDPTSALRVTRRRSVDRKKKQTGKNVFHCFVFGPKKSGKSALLNSFIGRPFSSNYTPTNDVRYVANAVEQIGGSQKTLILQEIPEDGVKKLLSNKECLAACDVAVFLYDSSDEYSWKRSRELLLDVARRGEESGYGVPCLLIAAKDDLDPFPMSLQNSARVTQQLGMEAPIPVGVKLRDSKSVFSRIVSAAEHPHLSIPETEKGKKRKRYRRLVNSSLMFVSVGAAVAVVGLAAYRAYAARKNT
ncbi:hypothetical protein CXB51_018904 [Gossypium anomalum]|uniref:Mitochondrial Rho GTPase n=1 Tax=Gossypium anomalum TaxID=47600 RepID=A0A8J5ZC61_9ROSI|nr:hypothetical protein CXB51_018904 [Gossypium anomalum]